ncbi:tyrosine-protein phosphatase [Lonsdalea populi]|uniref:tyrosine-protein phosphatase n=1 Tax=Lonsdalea populi TaxID=1172565 RepID=UPI000A21ED2F|nr:tyrosine-protein phosphatase [Lonsdalea populi]OSM97811.1 C4-dicarboxylate ABC transporter [Lonsdalea populi]RAT73151.1 C4-dicarboxylate ABC transporter [Lonsdalea populi]RAT74047.1 C4-dicarboxylate ABC transporter [Lonsdalea populi]RAT74132.1 C4-dicarboxylate ABC transporter [Lonsdalea populi]RAT79894.1 C4-dicarboxylate ABC transporter [Lonsdalea populi]
MTLAKMLHPSVLPLNGGINFRDLGGLATADGRRVRPGKLLRAGSLNELNDRDLTFLAEVPVAHVVDYRDISEAALRPDRLWEGVSYHAVPANPPSHEVTANLESLGAETLAELDARAFMLTVYKRLPFENSAYRHLVQLLQAPGEGALVQHCAVGKDRTGVGVALVLFALGADEQTVMEDYLLTETTLEPFRQRLMEELTPVLGEAAMRPFAFILSAREEFLQTALRTIRERHGSIDNWLMRDYGLDAPARERLRERYLD